MPAPSATTAADPWPLTPAWRVGLLQAALALSWTVYALFLPALAARAGLPAAAVPWLLMADQLLFLLFDNLAGLAADRLADAFRRLAGLMSAAGALAAVAFGGIALLPGAGGAAWLPVVVVWLVCSSLLRVPAMVMLSRRRGASRAHGSVSLAVVGLGLAGAVGPLLGRALAGIDPLWPFALAALGLAVAVAVVLAPAPSAAPGRDGAAGVATEAWAPWPCRPAPCWRRARGRPRPGCRPSCGRRCSGAGARWAAWWRRAGPRGPAAGRRWPVPWPWPPW